MQVTTEDPARTGRKTYRFVSSQTPNKLLDPTTDAGAARIQALSDRLASEFLAAAASNRGATVDHLLSATDGGGLLVGADAVTAGLADLVAGFETTLARLAAGDVPKRSRPPSSSSLSPTGPAARAISEDPAMKTAADTPAAAPEPTIAEALAAAVQLAAVQPAAPVTLAAPAIDPVAAERARCAAIQSAALPGYSKLAALAVSGGWPVEQFTQAQAASAEAVNAARTEAAGETFRGSLPAAIAGGGGEIEGDAQDPDTKWKKEFAASEALRAEFGSEGAYVHYKRVEASGKLRVISKRA